MKKLILLIALFALSCDKKEEPSPIKVISEEFILSDSVFSFYVFKFRNESDSIVDSFTVSISLYEDGLRATETRTYRDELVPYEECAMGIVFEYPIKDNLNVYFKCKFK